MAEKTPDSLREAWMNRLERESKAHKPFRDEAARAEKEWAARADVSSGGGEETDDMKRRKILPAFWSTVNVTHAALFSRLPRPDVRKRNVDVQAPTDRQIAMVVERGLTFTMDTTAFDRSSHMSVDDYLIAGLGHAKVEMHIETGEAPVVNPVTGEPILGEDGEPMMREVVTNRWMEMVHVYHSRFRWEPCASWEQCSWIGYDHYMGKQEFERQFKVDLPSRGTVAGSSDSATGSSKLSAEKYEQQLCVHEIWDRNTRRVIFISPDYPDTLEVRDDPLGLKGFFPGPRPMFANLSRKEVVPRPDFTYIRDLLWLINAYTSRITNLTRQVKDVGFYDAAFPELSKLTNAPDGTRIPISQLLERLNGVGEKATMDAVVVLLDNLPKVQVIASLMEQREQVKAQLDEMIGISDITRGSTNPNETATAQGIKNQWANVRLAPKLDQISKFFRDVFRIMAELLCERFEPEFLREMTGIEVTPDMLQVMRSDLLRAFAIDVETDSTIAQDDVLEREQRAETGKLVSDMLQTMLPAIDAGQVPADLAKQLMLFMLRSNKYGREFEDSVNMLPDNAAQLQQIRQAAEQAQQQAAMLQQQLEAAQQQLAQLNAQDEQRKNVKTESDAAEKVASAQRQAAEARRIEQESAVTGQVLPFLPPGQPQPPMSA